MNNFASQKQAHHNTRARSANRFYWIAGLTLFSTILTFTTKGGYMSATSLGIVEMVNTTVRDPAIGIGFSIFMAAVFAAFGWFARTGNIAVFIAGMAIYA